MNLSTRRARAAAVASAIALGASLGACGDDDEAPDATATTTAVSDPTASAGEPSGEELQITGAWARTSPSMATAGAVYLVIDNPTDSDDVLLSASVDPEIAGTVELHESKMADGEPTNGDSMDGDSMDGGGMMTMTPVDQIPVPAGGSVALEPGGLHIMLLDLAAPLEAGTTIEVALTFESAGEIALSADVRDSAP